LNTSRTDLFQKLISRQFNPTAPDRLTVGRAQGGGVHENLGQMSHKTFNRNTIRHKNPCTARSKSQENSAKAAEHFFIGTVCLALEKKSSYKSIS